MALRFEDLRVRDSQDIDRDFFNRRFRLIVEALNSLGVELDRIGGASDSLVTLGLARVNEVLGPALAQVSAAAENGFLVATSSTPLTLSVGLETTFGVDDTPARALFAPTPFVLASREGGTVDDWALLSVQSYNRENGGLAVEVIAINGDIGGAVHDDWVLSATAGVAKAVLEAAVDVENTLALAQQAANDAAAAASAAEAVLASGPVTSVNGKQGVVALGISDVPGLTTAIAGKADSSHGHTIAQVSNLQTTLTSLQTQITNLADGGTY